jgi:uncharacterized protein (DUF736 family)
MLKITSLWKNKDKNGNTYLSGRLGDMQIKIFTNQYKKEDKHPDFIMYGAESQKKQENSRWGNDEQQPDPEPPEVEDVAF